MPEVDLSMLTIRLAGMNRSLFLYLQGLKKTLQEKTLLENDH